MKFFRKTPRPDGMADDEIFPASGPLESPDDAFDHDDELRTAGLQGMAACKAAGARTDAEAFFGPDDPLLEGLGGTRVMRLVHCSGDADGEPTRPDYVRPEAVEQEPDEEVVFTRIGAVIQNIRSFLGLAGRKFSWLRQAASWAGREAVDFGESVKQYPAQAAACAAFGAIISLAAMNALESGEAEAASPAGALVEPISLGSEPLVEPIVEPPDDPAPYLDPESVEMTVVVQGAVR